VGFFFLIRDSDEITTLRPSFLRQFTAVVDFAINTPESFLRDLVVRNIPVVAVNREPNLYSINTVATDRALGANPLTRDLILGGHSHIAVVEAMPRSVVGRAVKQAALRYGPEALVRVSRSDEVLAAIETGATAIICDSVACARDVRGRLDAAGVGFPQNVSLSAIGCCDDSYPCSGQYVDCDVTARMVAEVISGAGNGQRPTTIWLAPRWVDCGTTCTAPGLDAEDEAA
jgi:DNA-binding LacI/PurR family transcriptional regulator